MKNHISFCVNNSKRFTFCFVNELQDVLRFLFERFKKLNNFSQGSGLGLSIARVMATKLGGTLYVDAEYTGGCRLVLTLPFVPV